MTATSPRPAGPHARLVLAGDVPREVVRDVGRRRTGIKVRRGAYYLDAAVPGAAEHDARRRLEIVRLEAVSRQLPGEHVFSHTSAALLWGLPLWSPPTAVVHVVQQHVPGERRARDVVRHRAALDPSEVVTIGGLPVTSRDRTVLDCVRTLGARDGLVLADAALRAGAGLDALRERLARTTGRGLVRARAVLDAADPGAESPGESVVRFELLRHGLPAPRTQLAVRTRLGRFRADMGWDEWRLLVEFDGLVKYRELAGGEPARVLYEEKRRQEAIEEEGWRVLRVTTPDVRDGAALTARVRRQVPRGADVPLHRRPGLS
jgi:very-short-patch-repair endonuclease